MLDDLMLKKLDGRLRLLSLSLFGIDVCEVKEIESFLYSNDHSLKKRKEFRIISDYMDSFEASVLLLLLAKNSLRIGIDFVVYECGRRFTILGSWSEGVEKALETYDKIRVLNRVQYYASWIINELKRNGEITNEDFDEAIDTGYCILLERTRAMDERCPRCHRTGITRLSERIVNGSFTIYAMKQCCGHTKKLDFPLVKSKYSLTNHRDFIML